jgi:hypothetical protein
MHLPAKAPCDRLDFHENKHGTQHLAGPVKPCGARRFKYQEIRTREDSKNAGAFEKITSKGKPIPLRDLNYE